jgi:ribokinase
MSAHAGAEVVCLASFNADLTVRVPRPLARGETLMASGFSIGPGGKGSNAAVACARQGARVAVIARLGRDDFARLALDLWAREGIDTRAVLQADGEPTGVAQICVYDDGDNSIAVAAGAGAGLDATHARAAAALIGAAKVVMAPNEVPFAATAEAFAIARAAGVTTLLNPAPARELPAGMLALCDIVTPNETELRALAGLGAEASLEAAAAVLLGQGVGAVVATLGAAGCVVFRQGKAARAITGHTMPVVDTVGAGDTFTGALAAALARGVALDDALPHANAAAALSVTGRGAIAGMPDAAATARFLQGT